MTPDRIDFIDENQTGGVFLALLEHIPNSARAYTDKHLNEIRARNREERHVSLARNRTSKKRLSRPGRPNHQNSLRDMPAKLLEPLGILQELDNLLNLLLGLLDTGHVLECDPVFLTAHHAGLGLSEIQRTSPRTADLLAEKKIQHQQEHANRQKPEQSGSHYIRFSLRIRLKPVCLQKLPQVGIVLQIDLR